MFQPTVIHSEKGKKVTYLKVAQADLSEKKSTSIIICTYLKGKGHLHAAGLLRPGFLIHR
jgi:hypothetical protein